MFERKSSADSGKHRCKGDCPFLKRQRIGLDSFCLLLRKNVDFKLRLGDKNICYEYRLVEDLKYYVSDTIH